MSKSKKQESICEEALRIQGGDRQQDYGSPESNLQEIGASWEWNVKTKCNVTISISARDVAHMMVLTKIARNIHKPKRDNWVDMAGYSQCGGKIDNL